MEQRKNSNYNRNRPNTYTRNRPNTYTKNRASNYNRNRPNNYNRNRSNQKDGSKSFLQVKNIFRKRFGFIFAFFGGFLAMLAIFLPAAYVKDEITNFEAYVWMWALYSYQFITADWTIGWIDQNHIEN